MPRPSAKPSKSSTAQTPARPALTLNEARYSQSLERGLAILSCFSGERPLMGIADLADTLGMSRSTTHRYVITLVALGYLEQVASRKYRLGLRPTDLGNSALSALGLREHSHPYLDELRTLTGYTTSLAVLDNAEVLYVDRARGNLPGQDQIDLGLHPGSRLPMHCTALGKILLANLPDDLQQELLAETTLPKRGPKTITGKKALREELERVHAAGLAIADEELAPGLRAIAAPVRDSSGAVVAAINLATHTSMIGLDELIDALGPHLIHTSERLSGALGFEPER